MGNSSWMRGSRALGVSPAALGPQLLRTLPGPSVSLQQPPAVPWGAGCAKGPGCARGECLPPPQRPQPDRAFLRAPCSAGMHEGRGAGPAPRPLAPATWTRAGAWPLGARGQGLDPAEHGCNGRQSLEAAQEARQEPGPQPRPAGLDVPRQGREGWPGLCSPTELPCSWQHLLPPRHRLHLPPRTNAAPRG